MNKDDYDFHYTVAGNPLAQQRVGARYVPGKGRQKGFIQMYDPPKCRKEKEHIAVLIKLSNPEILTGPIRVDLEFFMPRPLSHYGTGKNNLNLKPNAPTHHIKVPDIDNLRKLLMDALNKILWYDDSIICQGTTIKQYSDNPRTEIFIKILKESEEPKLW